MLETPKTKSTRLIMNHTSKNGLDATMDNQQETKSNILKGYKTNHSRSSFILKVE